MRNKIIVLGITVFLCGTGLFTPGTAAVQEPLVMLIQARGKVWYSTGGEKWKPVSRNKFLYEGWKVKTDPGATCKLSHRSSDRMEVLGPETEVTVRATGTKVVRGTLTSENSASSLPGHLKRKHAKVQKYITVQRAAKSEDRMEHRTAGRVVLNDAYPFLVWENAGAEYAYRLVVGEKSYDVQGSGQSVVRFAPEGLAPGEYPYLVKILYEGELFHTPDGMGTLVWMDGDQTRELGKKIDDLAGHGKANGFLLGSLLDDEGLKVAAMDAYLSHLKKNPGDNEVRPFLVKVLHELGLSEMREKEALLYRENAGK